MTENINSEALDKLFEIDGELWGSPSLVRMARIRASILHSFSAWGCSDDGALIGALADEVERLRRVVIDVAASLAAAISLLERGGKAAKKAAPSDLMFDQMVRDYTASLEDARAALGETE
jgi:hypothetical protein